MASQILTDAKVYVGEYDWSGDMNSIALEYAAEMKDATAFGQTTRINKGGLKTVRLGTGGIWSAGTGEVDTELFPIVGASRPISITPGAGSAGEACYLFRSARADYRPDAQVGELLTFRTSAVAADGAGLIRGTMLINATATASGTGTKYEVGAISATQKAYAALHVFAASAGDSLDVIIQSDADSAAGGETNQITFAQATAATYEWKELSGAVTDAWWRVSYTIAGTGPSFTFAVTFGIL